MVTKNKMSWTKSSNHDFDTFIKSLKTLSKTGIYASENAFFENDVFAYVASLECNSGIDLAKRNIILDTFAHARKFAPGTEVILSDMIVSNNNFKTKRIQRISSNEAARLTKQRIKTREAQHVFEEITELMGTTGRIHITEEPITHTQLKVSEGCEIGISIDQRFGPL